MVQIKLKGVRGVESPSPRSFWCDLSGSALPSIRAREQCQKGLICTKRDLCRWKETCKRPKRLGVALNKVEVVVHHVTPLPCVQSLPQRVERIEDRVKTEFAHLLDMTHSYVTWLMTHPYVTWLPKRLNSRACVTWNVHMWHDSWLIHMWHDSQNDQVCAPPAAPSAAEMTRHAISN